MQYFETRFLEEADKFISTLDLKTARKVFYNIDLAEQTNDPRLFKKLKYDIWEFRTLYNKSYYRLFAFWDKSEKDETIVISTHGITKKTGKTPKSEIEKAERLMEQYFKKKKI